ncbi:DUF4123 domain-containing protein [Hafnia alvei]|uniref:DUF4123 domain-containing protein n=1 Tax=Hafnia alvei TaxID=569 RepID=UPI0010352500|nr:DUF4123 domain-containing protein [Hafnia alvei]TBL82799.1 DUF4123 domain-containing protein [Hafnia alvei]
MAPYRKKHSAVTWLEEQELRSSLSHHPRYLLLQPGVIERLTYAGLHRHNDLFPPSPRLIELIKQSDPFIQYHWVWENTRYDRDREKGPILIDVTDNPTTLEQFIEYWGRLNGGIIICSEQPVDILLSHLVSVSTLLMRNGHSVRFNWLPNSLGDIFSVLITKKINSLIGPLKNIYCYQTNGTSSAWCHYSSKYSETSYIPILRLTTREIKYISLVKSQKFDESLAQELLTLSGSDKKYYPQTLALIKTCQQQLQKFNVQQPEHTQRFIHMFFPYMKKMNDERFVCVLANLQQTVIDRLDVIDILLHAPLEFYSSEYFHQQLISDWLLIPENKHCYFYDGAAAVIKLYHPPDKYINDNVVREQFLQRCGTSVSLAKHITQNNLPPLSVRREAQLLLSGDLFRG